MLNSRRRRCQIAHARVLPNLSTDRAFAFAASSSRLLARASVSRERKSLVEARATSSTATRNDRSFVFEGLLKPLIFRTNWSEAARISSPVAGGSKLKSTLMFRHNLETPEAYFRIRLYSLSSYLTLPRRQLQRQIRLGQRTMT